MKIINKLLFYIFRPLAISVLFFCHSAHGQGFNLDSFRANAQKISSDSERINFIIDRVVTLTCEDSAAKLSLCNEAKNLSVRQNWAPGIYKSNLALADIYMECDEDYQKGFGFLDENVSIADKNGDIKNGATAFETFAKKYEKLNQHDRAIEYFGKALTLNPTGNLRIGILAEVGHSYNSINDYPNAITYYDSALKFIESETIYKKGGNKMDTAMRLGLKLNMADIYLAMPDVQKALETFEDVLKASRGISNKRFIELSLTGIGKAYRQQKMFAKAIDYFQQALLVCRERSRFDDEASVLNAMSNTYLDSGNYNNAKQYSDSALALAGDQHFLKLLSKIYTTAGRVCLKQNHPDQAVRYLEQALDYSYQNKILTDQKDALYSLSEAYQQTGQLDKSLTAYKNYEAIKDSVMNIEKTNEAIRKDLEIKYKTAATRQADDYNRKLDRVKLFTYGSLAGLALVLALAFFMYRNYNIQKKYNALLSKEKKSNLAFIAAQSHVLSDIAHIQSHEIRGPVSAILGFMQVYNFEDPGDPVNKEIMHWIGESATKLDRVVRNVVSQENELSSDHADEAGTPGSPANS